MALNYPDLPDSPVSNDKKKGGGNNKSGSEKPLMNSPLSTAASIDEIPDFEKYEIRRAANGTGIFSSLFTISTLIFINEIRFFLYYHDYLSLNPFKNFLFSAGFIISLFQLIVIGGVLFVPSYLLQGNKIVKLAPLIIAILLQLFMLHFHESDTDLKIFIIQGWYGKYLIVKEFLMTYGTFFGSCIIFFCLNSAYNTPINKIFRTFEYVDYPEDAKNESPV